MLTSSAPPLGGKPLRYALYARKSSEGDERQIQSIDSQSVRVRDLSVRAGKDIVTMFVEARSAKEPGRPEFNRMLMALDAGEFDGILAWHPDRLSRNELDAAAVTWRLRKGVLKDMEFVEFFFHNSPEGIMMLQNALSQSQYQVSKLSIDVTRGLQDKLKLGWYPHRAPLGYRNNVHMWKGQKTISPDDERFQTMRKAWDLLLTGAYTVPQIAKIMNGQWGFRTPLSARSGRGGRPVPVSTLYRCLHNPFYTGMFVHAGILHKGAHAPMITTAEFEKAQTILGMIEGGGVVEEPVRARTGEHPYLGLIRCGHCAGMITATTVCKPSGKHYTYYHCSRGAGACGKRGVREDRLEEMIDAELSELDVPPVFHEWAVEAIEEVAEHSREAEESIREQRQRALKETDSLLDGLLNLGMRGLVTEDEFRDKKNALTLSREVLSMEERAVGEAESRVRQSCLNARDYAENCRIWLKWGDASMKRIIASNLGSNYVLTEGKLLLEPHPLLSCLKSESPSLVAKYGAIELDRNRSQSAKKAAFATIRTHWSDIWEANRTFSLQSQQEFPDVATQISLALEANGTHSSRQYNEHMQL